ncbi:unnamed protein product [Parajaminaea phylloscopi]
MPRKRESEPLDCSSSSDTCDGPGPADHDHDHDVDVEVEVKTKPQARGRKRTKTVSGAQEDEDKKKPTKRTITYWSPEEELALVRGIGKLALSNCQALGEEPGLKERSSNQINMKLRGMLKKLDQSFSGDGKWVADFKMTK